MVLVLLQDQLLRVLMSNYFVVLLSVGSVRERMATRIESNVRGDTLPPSPVGVGVKARNQST